MTLNIRAGALVLLAAVAMAGPCAPARAQSVTVAITSPKDQETVHDNTGKVRVSVAVKGLAPESLRVRVELDGRTYGPTRTRRDFTLSGVERGEHLLQVRLVNPAGGVIASSDAVKFYLWQASRLSPGHKSP